MMLSSFLLLSCGAAEETVAKAHFGDGFGLPPPSSPAIVEAITLKNRRHEPSAQEKASPEKNREGLSRLSTMRTLIRPRVSRIRTKLEHKLFCPAWPPIWPSHLGCRK